MTSRSTQHTQEHDRATGPIPALSEEDSPARHALAAVCKHFHEEAMAQCDVALEARRGGDTAQALDSFKVALGLETIAAMHAGLLERYRTQAILLHSAAEIAGNIDLLERGRWYERTDLARENNNDQ